MARALPVQIRRNNAEHLYDQVKEAISEYIERERLQPNDLLPSERELSEHLHVSRLTVRKAIDSLIQEGQVVRLPGRGTYVSLPKLEQRLLVLTSFTEAMNQEGHTPGTQVLAVELDPGSVAVCRHLEIPLGAEVLKVARLRFVDNLPFSLATSYLPHDLVGPLDAHSVQTQSLYALLKEKAGVQFAKTRATVEAAVADRNEAALLQVKPGAPLFRMTGTVRSDHGRVVEYFRVLYRGDRLRFLAETG